MLNFPKFDVGNPKYFTYNFIEIYIVMLYLHNFTHRCSLEICIYIYVYRAYVYKPQTETLLNHLELVCLKFTFSGYTGFQRTWI